jgi:hypothetical protein
MVRGLSIGVVVSMLLVSSGSSVAAGPAIHRGADVRFTAGGTAKESTLAAEGLGVRVSKRVGPETVKIRIEVANDAIDIDANAGGAVRLARRGKSVSLDMGVRDTKAVATARRLMEGSSALKSFGAMIAALESDQRNAAKSMLTSWALVNAIRGDDQVALAVARRFTAPFRVSMTPVSFTAREEMPMACWAEYATTITYYYSEYAQCLVDYAWIPGMVAVCSFEWAVKAELAWFWVIGCSGGVPV